MRLDKQYSPKDIEAKHYKNWEELGYFIPKGEGTPFSIVIPPPNVTGILHMGHALNLTLQDIICRHKRMQGFDVLWLPGTDHAGIATQNVVERQLEKKATNRFEMGREKFVKEVWHWKEEYGNRITEQIRRMGASVDWSRERFTMDEGYARAVKENFVELFQKDLIYRGYYLINWCPRCLTALSDIEVDHIEKKGHIWVIKYEPADGKGKPIIVATTRPETMFGDTAIAVRPDDKRYKDIIGKKFIIPLTVKKIPVIADNQVDKKFGTGAVKVTPAHDYNDYEIGKRHNLEQVIIFSEKGIMNKNVPKQFQGIDRFQCRKKLVEDLKETGQLIEEKAHTNVVGHCYRCHTVVEPYLSNQWFVGMKKLAKPAIDSVKSGQIKFVPERWEKLYFNWMEDIKDWCISRQIWWGHRIPVWYCECAPDKPIVSKTEIKTCPNCGGTKLWQDDDVLDTWFSSALWPFSTLGWPDETTDLKRYYPTSLLVTGYDIITFWVSRMITMGLENTKTIPFSKVYIHGLVRDMRGKKMSKSLGNALDPLELIDEFGADALRFALASLCTLGGQDIKLAKEKIESSRNFANKIWNVSRFIFMVLEENKNKINFDNVLQSDNLADQWILSAYNKTLLEINQAYETYNYALVSELLWNFAWNKFCDWYIEISKLNKEKSLPILIFLLTNILKMLHPYMPFITEEIWQKLHGETIMLSSWPKADKKLINPKIEKQMDGLINIIREIRNIRREANIQPKIEIRLILVSQNKTDLELISKGETYIKKLAKTSKLQLTNSLVEKPKNALSSVIGNVQIFIPLDGVIDNQKEKIRLSDQLKKIEAGINMLTIKLNNPGFVNNAPAEVIAKTKETLAKLDSEKKAISLQIEQLQ